VPDEGQGSRAVRLVIADDDEAMRLLLRATVGLLPSVEIVGEAADGVRAVELTVERSPHVALLDVNMPRVDGFEAAELIARVRPATRVLLHTAAMTTEKQFRARSLGVRLVDKLRLEELLEFAGLPPSADGDGGDLVHMPDQIESVVLLALAERSGEAVVIVRPDLSVPYYNKTAADLLDLPFPGGPMTIDELEATRPAVGANGDELAREALPLRRALGSKRPATDVVTLDWDGRRQVLRITAIPFFEADRTFLGVGNYIQPIADAGEPA